MPDIGPYHSGGVVRAVERPGVLLSLETGSGLWKGRDADRSANRSKEKT